MPNSDKSAHDAALPAILHDTSLLFAPIRVLATPSAFCEAWNPATWPKAHGFRLKRTHRGYHLNDDMSSYYILTIRSIQ